MGMDLNAIKSRLTAMNNDGQKREKVDPEKTFWRPTTGKHQIRIVPSAYDPNYPFKEMFFHYGIGKYPMLALSNFGEQDPIVDFVQELKKTSDSDNWKMAGKLTPKLRVFAPVIVRGEEDKGVRLWGFGKMIYKELLALAEDEDIGDYTDVTNGFDLIVEQQPGNPYPTTSVRIKPKMSELSDDNGKVESWLKEQPNPLESYTKYDYDFVKKQLAGWLDPEAAAQEESKPAPTPAAAPTPTPPSNNFTTENATKGKQDTVSQFDKMFGGSDDLPF